MTGDNTTQFHRAATVTELVDETPLSLTIDGWPVMLCRSGEEYHAVINRCTHAIAELATGRVRRGHVICPLHGARFELATGKCIGGPYLPLQVFETRIAAGWVEVAIPPPHP